MSDWSATRAGLNSIVKRSIGLPYRGRVRAAWRLSEGEFRDFQGDAFLRAYRHARESVPYYRDRPSLYPPAPGPLDAPSFLAALPVLPKAVVRENNRALWRAPLPLTTRVHRTSGTSGTPLEIAATVVERAYAETIFNDWVEKICGTLQPRSVFLSGFMTPSPSARELYWSDRATGSVYLSIYSLAPRNHDRIAALLDRLRPRRISGYASAIHQLAVLLGDALSTSRNERMAFSTSEVLHPEWRATIERNLCERVHDYYGSQEGSHLVLQCHAGSMHIHPLVGIVEIVREDGSPAPSGEPGRVLVSTIFRRTMPLFRYDLGDTAVSTGFSCDCSCGLRWPTVGRIEGRNEDLVRMRDGRRIGLLGFALTKNLRGVRESQLVQKDFTTFTLNVVREDFSLAPDASLEAAAREQLAARLQEPVTLTFTYMASIPRGPNGKLKAVRVEQF